MSPGQKSAAGILLLAGLIYIAGPGLGSQSLLSIQCIGTDHPSSFPKMLRVRLTNPAYTPINLMDAVGASELIVDGKSFHRADSTFDGPPGIAAKGDWDGCISPDDYAADLTSGSHKIRFKIAGLESNTVSVRWF